MLLFEYLQYLVLNDPHRHSLFGCGSQKVNDVALIEGLLHGGEGEDHCLGSLSANADTGGASRHTDYLEVDAVYTNLFSCGIFSFAKEYFVDPFTDDAHFSLFGNVDVVHITTIEHLASFYQVIFGVATLHQVGTVLFAPHHILVVTPGE